MDDIPIQAQILKKTFESAFEDIRKKYNLTMNEIILLLYLEKNKVKNTAKDIVEDVMVTKSHISKSVDSLVNKRMITRIQDKEDKKVMRLKITEDAFEVMQEITERNVEMTKRITKGVSKEDILVLTRVLKQIYDNVRDIVNHSEK